MRKDSSYFKHDANASSSPKLMDLLSAEKVRGYGVYWMLLETLRVQPEFKLPLKDVGVLARRFGTQSQVVMRVIRDYRLFVVENGWFYSPGLNRRLEALVKYLQGTLEQRTPQYLDKSLNDNDEGYIHARKPDQTKQNQKENSLSGVEERGCGKILSMEECIRLLPSEQIWCEDMARHSGRGPGFVRELPYLLDEFAAFIRRRGEEYSISGLRDAKRRFYYWMGLPEGVQAIKAFDKRTVETDAYRFETFVDGHRSYLGHPIPDDAPPRPSAFAVWDARQNAWTR